jgi:thiol-disulfide isomerase/thioredoxin
MRLRWLAAALGAATLTALAITVFSRWDNRPANGPANVTCPADAKTANLDFTMKGMDGQDSRLSDYQGKVILLNFWATWCGPCKREIPIIVELQEQYRTDGLQVIGISVDDTLEELEPFVKEFKMNYPVLLGLGHDDVQDTYGPLYTVPISVVISRDGRICAKHMGLPATVSENEPHASTVRDIFEAEIKALL